MKFEFATSNRIIFGEGSLSEVVPTARGFGKTAFLVVDSLERSEKLQADLRQAELQVLTHLVRGEPKVDSIEAAIRQARDFHPDMVIGMGGGSALDTAKTVSAFLTNPGSLLDYMEVIGKGQALTRPSVPCIAIPTTAGTGSEVTRNAVIGVPERRIKVSIRSQVLLPALAVVDPELTCSLPPRPTAFTGMDALTQLIEPFVSTAANPLTDAFCRQGIPRAARSLLKAYSDGQDLAAREDMALASLLGGLALANAKLGAVHGFANPLGGMRPAPHGAICARLLPLVMGANIRVLRSRQPGSAFLERYTEIARLLTGNPSAAAEEGVERVSQLASEMDIRPLSDYGLVREDFPALLEQAKKASSMKGNPISLSDDELLAILERSL